MHHPKIEALTRKDPRYAAEAYEFVFAALTHTQELLGREVPPDAPREDEHHVSGQELLQGVRDLAQREYGLMARMVFRAWGINATDDFGEIVFNLVEAGLMSKTPTDSRKDFHAVFDLGEGLTRDYRIEVPCDPQEGT